MKFTFLGTGTSQGVPVITCDCAVCRSDDPRNQRLRTSGLIQTESTTICIDTGPDFRQQMLREKVKTLDAVVFTHQHKDHVAGLDDVRAYNFSQKKEMAIFGNEITISQIKKEFAYVFSPNLYPGIPRIQDNIIKEDSFKIGDIELTPIPVMHHELPVLGFRTGDFAYVTDVNHIPESSMKKLQGLEVLVLSALRLQPHYSHFTLEEAINVVEILKPRKAYFTHISHFMGLHEDASAKLPPNIEIGYDGLSFEL